MKRKFNSKEAAQRHLEYRKKCAYRRIEKRGDEVLGDNSFVMYHDNENKWSVMLMIVSKQMRDDLTEKWSKAGLLEGLEADILENLALLLAPNPIQKINEL